MNSRNLPKDTNRWAQGEAALGNIGLSIGDTCKCRPFPGPVKITDAWTEGDGSAWAEVVSPFGRPYSVRIELLEKWVDGPKDESEGASDL